MDPREIRKEVRKLRAEGVSSAEILSTLQPRVPAGSEGELRVIILSVPDKETKERNRVLNWVLVALLALGGAGKLFAIYFTFSRSSGLAAALGVLGILVSVLLIWYVLQFERGAYVLTVLLSGLSLSRVARQGAQEPMGVVLDLGLIAAIIAISIIQMQRVFPDLTFFGKEKPDSSLKRGGS